MLLLNGQEVFMILALLCRSCDLIRSCIGAERKAVLELHVDSIPQLIVNLIIDRVQHWRRGYSVSSHRSTWQRQVLISEKFCRLIIQVPLLRFVLGGKSGKKIVRILYLSKRNHPHCSTKRLLLHCAGTEVQELFQSGTVGKCRRRQY